jgi:hypothetical protein
VVVVAAAVVEMALVEEEEDKFDISNRMCSLRVVVVVVRSEGRTDDTTGGWERTGLGESGDDGRRFLLVATMGTGD